MCQPLGCPGGPLEEVVLAVQSVALAVVGNNPRITGVTDAAEGVPSQAEEPGQQEMAGRDETGLGEGRAEILDDRRQRGYHGPHGKSPVPAGMCLPFRIRGSPPSSSPLSGQSFADLLFS